MLKPAWYRSVPVGHVPKSPKLRFDIVIETPDSERSPEGSFKSEKFSSSSVNSSQSNAASTRKNSASKGNSLAIP